MPDDAATPLGGSEGSPVPPESQAPSDPSPRGGDATAMIGDAVPLATTEIGTLLGTGEPGDRGEKAGDFIGRYRLIAELGEGGFGVVWRAEQTEPIPREVALKVIREQGTDWNGTHLTARIDEVQSHSSLLGGVCRGLSEGHSGVPFGTD